MALEVEGGDGVDLEDRLAIVAVDPEAEGGLVNEAVLVDIALPEGGEMVEDLGSGCGLAWLELEPPFLLRLVSAAFLAPLRRLSTPANKSLRHFSLGFVAHQRCLQTLLPIPHL